MPGSATKRARDKAYRQANKARIAARYKVWYEANKDQQKAYQKAWFQENKDSIDTEYKKLWEAEASGGFCAYCLKFSEQLHLEHCTPLSRGGWNTLDNVVMACSACNLSKGTKTVLEYACKMD